MTPSDEEQQNLLEFLYGCPVGLIEIDGAGNVGIMNPHAMKHLHPIAGAGGMLNLFDALEGCAPELRHLNASFLPSTGTVVEGHRIAVELGEGDATGGPLVLACTLVRLGVDRAIATLADITQQVAQERRLRQAETWFSSLIDDVNDYAVLTLTCDGRIETVNSSFTRQTGYACANLLGLSLDAIMQAEPEHGTRSFREQLRIAERDGWSLEESWQQRADGSRYWCQRLFAARAAQDGACLTGFTVVLRDVPHRAADTAELHRLLTRDQLTGAANRGHFRRVLAREQERSRSQDRPLGLIMFDLDHFKSVNDSYGHPAGDALLKAVAEACMARLRTDDVFARIGGEEFAVLLPSTTLQRAADVAEALRRTIADLTLDVAGGPLSATASFGCATLGEAKGSTDALIALADRRLYAAKHAGRNRICSASADLACTLPISVDAA